MFGYSERYSEEYGEGYSYGDAHSAEEESSWCPSMDGCFDLFCADLGCCAFLVLVVVLGFLGVVGLGTIHMLFTACYGALDGAFFAADADPAPFMASLAVILLLMWVCGYDLTAWLGGSWFDEGASPYGSGYGGWEGGSWVGAAGAEERAPPVNSPGAPLAQGVCGLHNLGNTCYMNAALQCLFASTDMVAFLEEERGRGCGERGGEKAGGAEENGGEEGEGEEGEEGEVKEVKEVEKQKKKERLFDVLSSLLKEMRSGKWNAVAPTLFLSTLQEHLVQFEGNDQQDAQEFLCCLLDGLHEETRGGTREDAWCGGVGGSNEEECKEGAKQTVNTTAKMTRRAAAKAKADADADAEAEAKAKAKAHAAARASPIERLFGGELTTTIACPFPACGHEAKARDLFRSLSLPLPNLPVDVPLTLHASSCDERR